MIDVLQGSSPFRFSVSLFRQVLVPEDVREAPRRLIGHSEPFSQSLKNMGLTKQWENSSSDLGLLPIEVHLDLHEDLAIVRPKSRLPTKSVERDSSNDPPFVEIKPTMPRGQALVGFETARHVSRRHVAANFR